MKQVSILFICFFSYFSLAQSDVQWSETIERTGLVNRLMPVGTTSHGTYLIETHGKNKAIHKFSNSGPKEISTKPYKLILNKQIMRLFTAIEDDQENIYLLCSVYEPKLKRGAAYTVKMNPDLTLEEPVLFHEANEKERFYPKMVMGKPEWLSYIQGGVMNNTGIHQTSDKDNSINFFRMGSYSGKIPDLIEDEGLKDFVGFLWIDGEIKEKFDFSFPEAKFSPTNEALSKEGRYFYFGKDQHYGRDLPDVFRIGYCDGLDGSQKSAVVELSGVTVVSAAMQMLEDRLVVACVTSNEVNEPELLIVNYSHDLELLSEDLYELENEHEAMEENKDLVMTYEVQSIQQLENGEAFVIANQHNKAKDPNGYSSIYQTGLSIIQLKNGANKPKQFLLDNTPEKAIGQAWNTSFTTTYKNHIHVFYRKQEDGPTKDGFFTSTSQYVHASFYHAVFNSEGKVSEDRILKSSAEDGWFYLMPGHTRKMSKSRVMLYLFGEKGDRIAYVKL